jgi:hypothetical protein
LVVRAVVVFDRGEDNAERQCATGVVEDRLLGVVRLELEIGIERSQLGDDLPRLDRPICEGASV